MSFTVRHIEVRASGEWGTFFVHEPAPVTDREGQLRFSATFACHTSFGAFGYYWHSMGCPFWQFSAQISPDYLLSKIGRMEPDAELICAGVRRQILQKRYDRLLDRDQARESWEFVLECADGEYASAEICGVLHRELPFDIDFDFKTRQYTHDCQAFVRKLWPAFVAQLQAATATPTPPVEAS